MRGMTLVEILIYAAILIALTSALVGSMLSLRNVLMRNAQERAIATAAENVLERFSRDVRDADSVNLLLSTLGATSSVLVLESGATTTTYHLEDNRVHLSVEGDDYGPLTPRDVSVDELVFVHYDGSSSDMVRIMLTLSVTGRYASSSEQFTTAAVLRGSYEE